MRVGIDARLLYYRQGGISTYVRCLIRELAALSRGEQYVVLQSRKDASSVADGRGIEIVRSWTPCHSRFEQLALPVELASLKLDLLHSPDFIPPFYRRCKSVITVHDLAFLRYPHLLTAASRSYYLQIGRAVKSADAIIAVSMSTRNDLIELLGASEEKISVISEASDAIFRPIDDELFLDAVRERYKVPEKFILFSGTIEPRKNLPTLIKAFAKCWRQGEDCVGADGHRLKLVIAGAMGWLYEEVFASVAALGIEDLVIFTGPVTGQYLNGLYNLATVFVMPSLYEGFGLPVLEAMACGTPVIASNTSSLPEVVGDAGLIVDPLDVDGWARAISRVLGDRALRDDLCRRGLRRAAEFSWRKAAEETRAVYERVLGG